MHFSSPLLRRTLSHAMLALAAASLAPAVLASDAPPKKSKTVKVKQQQNNSQETAAERDRRLYRECKGMPNAGACLGYTRR